MPIVSLNMWWILGTVQPPFRGFPRITLAILTDLASFQSCRYVLLALYSISDDFLHLVLPESPVQADVHEAGMCR